MKNSKSILFIQFLLCFLNVFTRIQAFSAPFISNANTSLYKELQDRIQRGEIMDKSLFNQDLAIDKPDTVQVFFDDRVNVFFPNSLNYLRYEYEISKPNFIFIIFEKGFNDSVNIYIDDSLAYNGMIVTHHFLEFTNVVLEKHYADKCGSTRLKINSIKRKTSFDILLKNDYRDIRISRDNDRWIVTYSNYIHIYQ